MLMRGFISKMRQAAEGRKIAGLVALSFALFPTASVVAQSLHDSSGISSNDAEFSSSLVLPSAPEPAVATLSGGRTYGSVNRNWSSRFAFEGGGGFNAPVDSSSRYITWGGNFTVGAGYRFSPHVSLMTEYQFIIDKLPGRIISETGANGGNAHIWSFTLDPVVDLFPKSTNDIYITGGGGFYRKVTNFTDPVNALYCDYYYCGIVTQNQVVGHFSSNQGGYSIGAGFTHRLWGNSNDGQAKLFAEARYLDVLTPAVIKAQPNGLGSTTVEADTVLIPVTIGVRF